MKNSAPIGFLDSGIGGSNVLIKTLSVLPNKIMSFSAILQIAPTAIKVTVKLLNAAIKSFRFLLKITAARQ